MVSGVPGMHVKWSHDSLADKLSVALQNGYNEDSIEELTSHVQPSPVWLKGKKEGLYLLMTGGRTKRIQSSTGMAAKKPILCRFFSPSHAEFFFFKKSMFHAVFVWKGIAAHAGGGQRAPEKSISGAEMYSGIQAWGNMLVQTQHTPSSSNTHSRACISKSRVSRIQVTVTPVMVPKVKH